MQPDSRAGQMGLAFARAMASAGADEHRDAVSLFPPWSFTVRLAESSGVYRSPADPLTLFMWHQIHQPVRPVPLFTMTC